MKQLARSLGAVALLMVASTYAAEEREPAADDDHVWVGASDNASWIDGKYRVVNNLWGSGKDCTMWADSHSRWAVLPNYPKDEMHVKAYPGCWRGFHYSEESAPDSGFPVRVRDLTRLKGRWSMREPATGRHWALWDIYLAKESKRWEGKGWVNLMIFQSWHDPTGWIPKGLVNPGKFRPVPLGRLDAGDLKLQCTRTAADWIKGPVITAIGDRPMADATYDLKQLLDNLVKAGVLDDKWYLIGIEVGWEIHECTSPLITEFFAIDLNDESVTNYSRSTFSHPRVSLARSKVEEDDILDVDTCEALTIGCSGPATRAAEPGR